jgi:hypothetical protein
MIRTIGRYPHESDLQLEERINLTLMCDAAQDLILQRKFNDETAAFTCVMKLKYFECIKIDKLFDVLVLNKDQRSNVALNIKITCEQWKALYETYSTVNEWAVDIDNNCIINIQDDRQLRIPKYCAKLWQYDGDPYNQRIIDERLIRYIVAKDILKHNRRNKTL